MKGEMKKRANEMLKNGFFLYNQKQHIHASTMHFGPISFDLHEIASSNLQYLIAKRVAGCSVISRIARKCPKNNCLDFCMLASPSKGLSHLL